ncbi:MAG: glycosyltransferase [Deferribacterales bacterium]
MSEPKCFVLFSTADWGHKYLTNKQHVTMSLADRGYRVMYVESIGIRQPGINAQDISRIFKRLIKGLLPVKKVRNNVWVYSPLTIPFKHHMKIVKKINNFILSSVIKTAMFFLGFRDACVWTYHPLINDVLKNLRYSKLVYHSVDDLTAVPGIDKELIRRNEDILLGSADHVFVTSRNLEKMYSEKYPDKVHYFSNVADIEMFSKARSALKRPEDMPDGVNIMYIGVLTDFKLDFRLVYEIAIAKPDWNWIFIGEEREGQNNEYIKKMADMPNVYYLGYRPYTELPYYLKYADVAVLPSLINDYTVSMFPMKFFEYLAAGKPVVGTKLPALKEFTHMYSAAEGSDEFVSMISEIVDMKRDKTVDLKDIEMYSYNGRIEKMLKILQNF